MDFCTYIKNKIYFIDKTVEINFYYDQTISYRKLIRINSLKQMASSLEESL